MAFFVISNSMIEFSGKQNLASSPFTVFFFVCVFRLWFVKWDMAMNPCPTTKQGGRGLGALGRKKTPVFNPTRVFELCSPADEPNSIPDWLIECQPTISPDVKHSKCIQHTAVDREMVNTCKVLLQLYFDLVNAPLIIRATWNCNREISKCCKLATVL